MPRKNPAAVALGRRTSKRKQASSRANGRLGGRPVLYRLSKDGTLEKRQGDRWITLEPPLDEAAKAYLRRRR